MLVKAVLIICMLLVSYSPLFLSLYISVKPLKIFQDLQNITLLLGQPLKMQCEIYPGNVLGRWYRNGQLIQPNDRINIIHRNRYVLSALLTARLFVWNLIIIFCLRWTTNVLIFQDPPTWNCSLLPSRCGRLHFCTRGIFTEPFLQNPYHWYTQSMFH